MAGIKDGREYRIITRAFEPVDTDNPEDCIVEGYATTFDVPYDMYGGYKECIKKSALDGADLSDVIFLLNHGGMTLARQRNGSLGVSIDDHGLAVRANLGALPTGREVYQAVKSGLIDKMSWAFTVAEDGWEFDRATKTSYITRIDKVFDVSAVNQPADQDTVISARSYLDGVIEAEKRAVIGEAERLSRKKLLAELKLKGA